ncbi:MAG: alpha/beta hydrolase [Myxococcales bacterium]|nr:alpha/beta hydrolase [Myxococcales bacterium]
MRPESPSDPPIQTLRLRKGPVSYTREGAGHPVVALHGCPGSVRDWRWMGPALRSGCELIRLDLPGYGGTPLRTASSALAAKRAAFVLEFADTLGLDTFSVLAHSAGGPVALELAVLAPERVRTLALIAVPGGKPHRAIRRSPNQMRLTPIFDIPVLRAALNRPLRQGFVKAGFSGDLPIDSYRQSMRVAAKFDFPSHERLASKADAPTLIAWAVDDELIEPEISEALADKCPDGERLVFPSGGHLIQKHRASEISEAFLRLIEDRGR